MTVPTIKSVTDSPWTAAGPVLYAIRDAPNVWPIAVFVEARTAAHVAREHNRALAPEQP